MQDEHSAEHVHHHSEHAERKQAVDRGKRHGFPETQDPQRDRERDPNQEALEQVEKATDSEPIQGEELLKSEPLKRQLREAKERLAKEEQRLEQDLATARELQFGLLPCAAPPHDGRLGGVLRAA